MIATDGVGPPGPEMRRPSFQLGRHTMSIERATIGTYPATARMSSALSRLACAALSAEEALAPRKEGEPCR